MESLPSIILPQIPLSRQENQIKSPKLWNSFLRTQSKLKNHQQVLTSAQAESSGSLPSNFDISHLLKACARLEAVEQGKKIHFDIRNTPLIDDLRVRTALIDFYCKCGLLDDAGHLFDETTKRDLVVWNAMISGYASNLRCKDAIALFFQMGKENLKPNSVTLVSLLSACSALSEWRFGQEIHCYCLRNGLFYSNAHVGTSLISFYSRFDVRASRFVFDLMALKTRISWNAMISCYFYAGEGLEALNLFAQMLVIGTCPCSVTMLVIVQSCADFGDLDLGKQVHQLVIKFGLSSDVFVVNALTIMYAKCGSLESSCELFERMSARDIASWNAMMFAYKTYGQYEKALGLFGRMKQEIIRGNIITFATMFSICAESRSTREGKVLHAYIIKCGKEIDLSLGNALLSMYANFDCVEYAHNIFSKMHELDVVSWNTLISAFIHSKRIVHAWLLFRQMEQTEIKPNSFTMVSILAACRNESFLNIGRSIHGYVIRLGLELNSALCTAFTDMYMDCGHEASARHVFERFLYRDLISWNAMIASYVRNGQPNKAFSFVQRMQLEVKPNLVTMINVLPACAHLTTLLQGRCIHACILRKQFDLDLDVSAGNALLTMYAKCGSIWNAEKVFKALVNRDVVSFNAMIAGHGMHGHGEDAIITFSQMQEAGLRPTGVTFVSLLSACSHSGLIEKGWQLFQSMSRDYNITPEVVHYACMVDLLGRAGHLNEAKSFIDSMPVEPDANVWRALLGACRVFSNIKLAQTISRRLIELEPMNIGNFILLSNIHAASGNWDDVKKIRKLINEKGLRKIPGNSWIVIKNKVHSFTVGDRSHPQSDKIYSKLSCITAGIREIGYVPDSSWVLHDVEDEEKDQRLFSHSEKLAIAFGLLNVSTGAPILITKNLRVCGDCHAFSKRVSKFTQREIILRDASRFHHFVNGVCSCKDYW